MKYRLGLVGCGVVGQGFLEILAGKAEELKDRHGFEAKVVAVTDKLKGTAIAPAGLDLKKILKLLESGKPLDDYGPAKAKKAAPADPLKVIGEVEADIFAELTYTDIKTGEPATSYIRKALQTGKHVVTSNKGPAALHYRELADLARKRGRHFRIEGTVMSGTPVFTLLERGFAGNQVREVKGILNGTTNFILTKMELEGMEYADALALAQKLGYAEADPTADVEGFDALAKVVILSNVILGGSLKPSDLQPRGISGITKPMVSEAKAEGCRYKLVAFARRAGAKIEAGVEPRKLPLSDPLTGVMGAQNALTFDLDLLGQVTVQGPGAGKLATGQAILQDVLAIHHDLR
ncbi:MAG: homoserine dehydrogenase [Candidatus Aminicenantes bacterium]|nr:homoserine dehydrogenase [Candidatus Aminicenantes bacterium]